MQTLKLKPTHPTHAQLIHYANNRGLPQPIFDWNPHFNRLPIEIIENIVFFAAFEVSKKHNKSPYGNWCLPGVISKRAHTFNSMALVSKRMNECVESYSELLLIKHASLGAKLPKATRSQLSTSRASWLSFIADKCAFCFKTRRTLEAEAWAAEEASTVALRGQETENAQRNHLEASPFNHDMLCCSQCEQDHWPNQILLEHAIRKFELPACLFLFPPTALHVGKRDAEGTTERVSLEQQFGLRCRLRDMYVDILFLEHEVANLKALVISNPREYIPTWVTQLPERYN